ncbi:MAG TPA: ABC transporter permease, partial [Elusimicrobiota bacterium]|nr:ABC transporter permease [Elusimicrobiota bacterium]
GNLTSVIAISCVAVGVAALVVTLAVMTGFREDIRGKILGAQPHLVVMGSQGSLAAGDWSDVFLDVPDVQAWAPFVLGQALIRKGSTTLGVVVKGVEPEKESQVTQLDKKLVDGRWDELAAPTREGVPVFLGKELARSLNVSIGDEVLIAVPTPQTAVMSGLPSLFPFKVAGILETGLYDYDSSLAVTTLPAAQTMFQMPKDYSGLGVRLKDPDDSLGAAMRVQKNIGSAAWVRSWLALNRNLFAALKLEKIVMFIVLTLITLVAAFTIVSNLLLVTAQRVHEIGILRAMGATRGAIQRIFLLKGLLMGTLGTAVGVGLGLALSLVLKRYQFIKLPADVYYVETLPVKIMPSDVGLVAGAALLIVLIATLYPSRLAAKLDALSAIRQL